MNALRLALVGVVVILLSGGLWFCLANQELLFSVVDLSTITQADGKNSSTPRSNRIYFTRPPDTPTISTATITPTASPTFDPKSCAFTRWSWRQDNSTTILEGNELMKQLIQNNCKMLVYRLGGTESQALRMYYGSSTIQDPYKIWRESGVFPGNRKITEDFIKVTKEALKEATICVEMLDWSDVVYACKSWAPDSIRMTWPSLVSFWGGDMQPQQTEPEGWWGVADPWINSLANKTILVVSVFHITGPAQYYRNDSRVPRFKELKWLASPNALALNYPKGYEHKTWLDALHDLKAAVTAVGDFDYALLSCGAFGTPLLAHIKSLGKNGIYMGGSLQGMFGIRGTRWNKKIDERIRALPQPQSAQEASWWVKCHPDERPPNCQIMEDCAYG